MNQLLIAISLLALAACKPNNQFRGSTSTDTATSGVSGIDEKASSSKKPSGSTENKVFLDEASSGKAKLAIKSGTVSLTLSKAVGVAGTKTESISPLSIYFVLDRSTSMDSVLAALKSSVTDFARTLSSTGYDVLMGAVAFRDQVDRSQPLSKIAEFQSFIDRLDTLEEPFDINGDLPEGSLGASLQAIQKVQAEDARPNAEHIIVVVTDIVGHMGGPSFPPEIGRDCNPKSLTNALSLSKNVKFFYSVDPGAYFIPYSSASCATYATASQQFGQILNDVKASQPGTFVGQALAYPFDGKTLANQLLPIITKTLPPKTIMCTVKDIKITFPETGKLIAKSSTPDTSDGDKAVFKDILTADLVKAWLGKTLQIDVNRCCPANGKACASEVSKSTLFVLENKS